MRLGEDRGVDKGLRALDGLAPQSVTKTPAGFFICYLFCKDNKDRRESPSLVVRQRWGGSTVVSLSPEALRDWTLYILGKLSATGLHL